MPANYGVRPVRVAKAGAASQGQVTDYAGPVGYARAVQNTIAPKSNRLTQPKLQQPTTGQQSYGNQVSSTGNGSRLLNTNPLSGQGYLYNKDGGGYNTQDKLYNRTQYYFNPYSNNMEQRFVGRDRYSNIYDPRYSFTSSFSPTPLLDMVRSQGIGGIL